MHLIVVSELMYDLSPELRSAKRFGSKSGLKPDDLREELWAHASLLNKTTGK